MNVFPHQDSPGKEPQTNRLSIKRELSDEEVAIGLSNGDESVLGFVYSKYIHRLFRFGSQITKDNDIVKDCIQDVFASLVKQDKTISKISSIKSYLYKSLYRKIIERLKKERKYNLTDPILDNLEGFEIEISTQSRIINEEAYREKVLAVNRALKKLSKKQKQALLLYYFDGLSQLEIAEVMNLKDQNSVTMLIRRGLDAIRGNISFIILLLLEQGVRPA